MLTGAAIVFFTYIGFDSVSTAAEECKNPQRDLPFGIIATLIICAVLYISVALVLTGIASWKTLNNAAPVANALKALGFNRIRGWVSVGAHRGHDLLAAGVPIRAGAHLVRHVARRTAAQSVLQESTREHKTPHVSTWIAGLVVGIPAGIFDIGYVRGPVEYRDAVRLHRGFGRA